MVRIKVCGLMDPGHALAAARLGADLLGLVFAPSRRRVTPEQAREIVEVVAREFSKAHSLSGTGVPPVLTGQRSVPLEGAVATHDSVPQALACAMSNGLRPALVGVFVNQPPDEVNALAERCWLDFIQLSGDETPVYCRDLNRRFLKALRLAPEEGADQTAHRMDSYLKVNPEALFLLDTHVPGVYGGSGRPWDWERAAQLATRYPILIAGGLSPENVAAVVQQVAPWGVDVSSGVETDGVKDDAKIRAFIAAVRGQALHRTERLVP